MDKQAFDYRWLTWGSLLVVSVAILSKPARPIVQRTAAQITNLGESILAKIEPFVKTKEGYRPTAYRDPGAGIWTIGYGTTYWPDGRPVREGDTVTREQAQALLEQDIEEAATAVQRNVQVSLNDNELAALTSFVYNVGEGQFKDSTLLQKLNAGDRVGAANQLPLWKHGGGKELPGLVERRAEERRLMLGE
jgi:GH24 family phage-related lysozyme (muramidase)